ncbi:MAG: glutamine--fructose-6-phosphate transaminase (isomerizing) [Patescibacteria group bacterium]
MCGIVGYVGSKDGATLKDELPEQLGRLDYRGYDSAGLAWKTPEGIIEVVRRKGKIPVLIEALAPATVRGFVGIGHTRWATHGPPSDGNAHPQTDQEADGAPIRVAVVHNGIIENADDLKEMLRRRGHYFTSVTDTVVIPHLIRMYLDDGDDEITAIQKTLSVLRGAYAVAILIAGPEPVLYAARRQSPLVIGIAADGYYVASSEQAFVGEATELVELNDGEMVILKQGAPYDLRTFENETICRATEPLRLTLEEISRGDYRHFMLKEIFEQPEAIRRAFAGRISDNGSPVIDLGGIRTKPELAEWLAVDLERIVLVACGTAWHACRVGQRMLQKLIGLPVEVEYASEFITGYNPINDRTLVIAVSQSGETADTLEAVRKAKKQGARIWSICNVPRSTLTKEADSGMFLHSGVEKGVASTKAYTSMIVCLILFTLKLAEIRGTDRVTETGRREIIEAVRRLPEQIEDLLTLSAEIRALAERFADSTNFYYLGRGYNFPTALEGALKLKEISYIHAEGYPAAEMKHGPIALIDKDMPVVFIALRDDSTTYDKVRSNIEEVASRHGTVILIASEGDDLPARLMADGKVLCSFAIPNTLSVCSAILASIPLQLLAYHLADLRGCDIDQPRNLAKSVTVE